MNPPPITARARRLLEGKMPEYTAAHVERRLAAFDPEHRPDGYIGLCVAENGLMWDQLGPWMTGPFSVTSEVTGYGDMIGSEQLRQSVARVLERHVFHRSIESQSIVTMAGAGAVLEALFRGLADPGEGVLVPTPSYAGFWPDVQTRNDLQIVEVPRSPDDEYRLDVDLLDRALAEAPVPIRALLYTNPDNPLGSVASAAEVRTAVDWARSHGLHFVSDEIYALSIFGDAEFHSVGAAPLGEDVHVVWGASKDFGMSGLRAGVLVSESEAVREMMSAQAMWSSVSTHTQALLAAMWADDAFVDGFVRISRERLGARFRYLSDQLAGAGIAHRRSDAGFFTLVDLRAHLSAPTWDAETELWRSLLEETNVNLTPGSACRTTEPGLFRLCFASVSDEALEASIERLVGHLA